MRPGKNTDLTLAEQKIETLEARVEERTRELHDANEKLRDLTVALERRVAERTTELQKQRNLAEEHNVALTLQKAQLESMLGFQNDLLARIGNEQTGFLSQVIQREKRLTLDGEATPKTKAETGPILEQARRLIDFLRASGYVFSDKEKSLKGRTVAVCLSVPRHALLISRALLATGAEVKTFEGQDAVTGEHDVMLTDCEGMHRVAAQSASRTILLAEECEFFAKGNEILKLPISAVAVSNMRERIAQQDGQAVRELVVLAGKVLGGEIFGIEKYLGWGTKINQVTLPIPKSAIQ